MSLPAGVTTCNVIFNTPLSFAGGTGTATLTIRPTQTIIWAATGQPLGAFSDTVTTSAQPGSMALPVVDQPGFVDSAGNTVTNWAYTADVLWTVGTQNLSTHKSFQLLTGQTSVTFDLIPDGNTTIAVTAPTATVTSVNGATGPITLDSASVGLSNVDNTSDANKPLSTAATNALALKQDAASLDTTNAGLVNDSASATAAALNATYVPAAFKRAVNLSVLPGWADNTWDNNAVPFAQDQLWTYNGKQYAVWANDIRNPIIGVRTLPQGRWATFDLSTVAGNPLMSPTSADGHNDYSIGIDSAGYIHVSGNMHGQILCYTRSTNPEDITSWTAASMIGTEENLCTYPRFIRHPDGTLFFHYRNGASSNGNTYLNRLATVGANTWTRVAQVSDGVSTAESCYDNKLLIDKNGIFHYSFTWKNGVTYNDISDIGYMRSTDKGATWTTVTGVAVTLPFTHATSPVVLDTPTSNSGIANQFGMDVDSLGRPHMATFFFDGTNRQINHFWWDGTVWHNDKVTDLTTSINDFTHWPARPFIAITKTDRIYIGFNYRYEGLRGKLRLIDVTGGQTYATAQHFPILDIDLREWEGTFDTQALRDRNELHIIVTPCNADPTAPRPEYYNADNWNCQWLGVLTIDMAQIDLVQRGSVALPTIKPVASISVAENTTTAASGLVTIAGVQSTITPSEIQGKLAFVRIRSRMSVTAGTGSIAISEIQQGGSSRTFGTISTANTSTQLQAGPWMPLKFGPRLFGDSLLRIFGACTAGGTLILSACTLEIGVLDGPVNPSN